MTLALWAAIAVSRGINPDFDCLFFDCTRAGLRKSYFPSYLYSQSSDGNRVRVSGLGGFAPHGATDILPELAWEGSLHTFICSDATQRRTWFIEKGADGRYQARKASRFFLPSRETADGRARATWSDYDFSPSADLNWKLTLILNGKPQVFTVSSFNKVSAAHPTTGFVTWSAWSPSGRYFAVCLNGVQPGREYSNANETLSYVIDGVTGHIRLMGHGFRGCWLSDHVFCRVAFDSEDRENASLFNRTSVIEDLRDPKRRTVLPEVEILSSTANPAIVCAIIPGSAGRESVRLAGVDLRTRKPIMLMSSLVYPVISYEGSYTFSVAAR